jgi:Flp pilus assembly protein TadG
MGQYIDKFNDTIGKRQSQQILKSLNKKRNSGQIRTIEEFSKRFEELIRDLQSTVLSPTLKVWMAQEDDYTDSEAHNTMLDSVQDDLESAFEEANNIDEVQRSHEAIMRDVVLKNLRSAVKELEGKVNLYEFINNDTRGFDSAIFTTFRESKENRTERSQQFASIFFTDPRTGTLVSTDQDAEVELVGERLVLANTDKSYHSISNIRQIFDDETPQSELVVEPSGTRLNNLIDGTRGTYWVQSLLFKQKRNSVNIQLELNLGINREINFIEIEPAVKHGITLEEISYLDNNNVITPLGIAEVLLDGAAVIRIRKISTKKIILTFRNDNFGRVHFEYDGDTDSLFSQALLQPPGGISPTKKSTQEDLNDMLSSAKVKEVLGVRTKAKKVFTGYQFVTGFDNIYVGITESEQKSIYVSSPLEICGAGQIGIRVAESRPFRPAIGGITQFTTETYDNNVSNEIDNPVTKGRLFLGSIEYWIIRQDFNIAGSLVKTTTFPILPLGVQRVHQERLVLTEKSVSTLTNNDIGTLMFFTNRTDGDIKVYRNGVLDTDETGNPGATTGWKQEPETPDGTLRTPNNGERMRFKIKVLNNLAGDIFTVSYTPLLSTTKAVPKSLSEFLTVGGVQIVDLVGDLSARSSEGQLVLLDRIGEDDANQTTKIYLVIMLRQNTADTSLSPAVEEYTLVAGCKDPTKFEEV